MDTRLATTQIRLSEWTAIIQDRNNSGLKVSDYCKQHNLSENAYYYWLRKAKEAALQQAGFVEIPCVGSASCIKDTSFIPQMTIRYADLELGISTDTPTELIKKTLDVIRHAE